MNVSINDKQGLISIDIPASFKRRGSRRLIIAPEASIAGGGDTPAQSNHDEKLINAVVKAYQWAEWIKEGKYSDTHALASKLGIERSYVSRVVRLTLLAPDIIEHILAGTQPRDLTLQKIIRGFPRIWQEQREKYGFPPPDQEVL